MNIQELLTKLEPVPLNLTDDQLENVGPQLMLSIAISLKRQADINQLHYMTTFGLTGTKQFRELHERVIGL